MKAAVITKDFQLQVWDLPEPSVGEYDVLCKMEYGTTCCGTDLRLMRGGHPRPIQYPTILGHESVGRVIEVGKKVKNFHCGDLVTRVGAPSGLLDGLTSSWGGFAEYGIAKDHWQMAKDGVERDGWDRYRVNQIVPKGIDSKTAPMMITWRETFSYVKRLGVRENSRVLVLGSGANALAFVAHCTNLGADVWCVGNKDRRAVFASHNIHNYYDYKNENLKELLIQDHATALDFIIDGIGTSGTVNKLLFLLKKNGVVGIYGWNDRDTAGINPFMARDTFILYSGGYDEEEAHEAVSAMILKGMLKANDWYDLQNPVPLSQISDAYNDLKQHKALKILISF